MHGVADLTECFLILGTARSRRFHPLAPLGIGRGDPKLGILMFGERGLGHLQVRDLDQSRIGAHGVISTEDSPVTILVVANNDERLLAWETLRAIERSSVWPHSRSNRAHVRR